jgi:uncharacterized RDD family membrane protein YckC
MLKQFIIDFFTVAVVFIILTALFAVIGFPLILFILGNFYIKAISLIIVFSFSIGVVYFAKSYKGKEENE